MLCGGVGRTLTNVRECYGVDDCAYDETNRAHASECAAGVEAYGRRHDRRATRD